MMLGEIDWPKTLTAAGALLSVAFLQMGKFFFDWRAAKKEDRRDEENKQIQIEQRDCLRQLERGQTIQNGKLSAVTQLNESHYTAVMEVSKIRHDEMLRGLQSSCHHVPTIVQQVNQPKEK